MHSFLRKRKERDDLVLNIHGIQVPIPKRAATAVGHLLGAGFGTNGPADADDDDVNPLQGKGGLFRDNNQKISTSIKDYFKSITPTMSSASMDVDGVHGDACDKVDKVFGRDGEDKGRQESVAARLWRNAPRIYDDEIIVRMPLYISQTSVVNNTTNNAGTWKPRLATAPAGGAPLIPHAALLQGGAEDQALTIRLNDIYDPYPQAPAYAPRGCNWYNNLYKYYQVLETKWTVRHEFITNQDVPNSGVSAASATQDIPIQVFAQVTDVNQTDITTVGGVNGARSLQELGYTNGADKSIIIHGPVEITHNTSGIHNTKNGVTFSGTWSPAMFDDLQIDITKQPMTATGSSPNWLNYLDSGYINYNQTDYTPDPNIVKTTIILEFLVHFKKVNMSQYKLVN